MRNKTISVLNLIIIAGKLTVIISSDHNLKFICQRTTNSKKKVPCYHFWLSIARMFSTRPYPAVLFITFCSFSIIYTRVNWLSLNLQNHPIPRITYFPVSFCPILLYWPIDNPVYFIFIKWSASIFYSALFDEWLISRNIWRESKCFHSVLELH